jgi:hypothetical protein
VGQAFAYGGYGALIEAARELLDDGSYGFMDRAAAGVEAGRAAFTA